LWKKTTVWGKNLKVVFPCPKLIIYFKTSQSDENRPSFPLTLPLSPQGEREEEPQNL
jgi:hypothetical protein